VWRSLVARVVRDDEVAGSNPVTPTECERLSSDWKGAFLLPPRQPTPIPTLRPAHPARITTSAVRAPRGTRLGAGSRGAAGVGDRVGGAHEREV
jgi:hypothetical protein